MIGRQESSSTETLVPLNDMGGSTFKEGANRRTPTSIVIPSFQPQVPHQSCFSPAPESIRNSMYSSSSSSSVNRSSTSSLIDLLVESQGRASLPTTMVDPTSRRRTLRATRNTASDRHIVAFDEAKMTRRIQKDIKRGRLTRVRSSDSFLEDKAETSRRVVRSYLSFGHESGVSLDKLSRQAKDHDHIRSSFTTLDESAKEIEALGLKNEMFHPDHHHDAERLRRASAAASAGRALLAR